MSPTGNNPTRSGARPAVRAGFTLIELILVMAVLVIVLAVVAPSLGNFFRGRTLDSEARRFVSLTRYAESRAVSEGIPMLLWIDTQQRTYGLTEEVSYETRDIHAITYDLGRDVLLEVMAPVSVSARREQAQSSLQLGRSATVIRFQPDGFLGEGNPEVIGFRPDPSTGRKVLPTDAVWVALSANRLHYEIPTNQLAYARR